MCPGPIGSAIAFENARARLAHKAGWRRECGMYPGASKIFDALEPASLSARLVEYKSTNMEAPYKDPFPDEAISRHRQLFCPQMAIS